MDQPRGSAAGDPASCPDETLVRIAPPRYVPFTLAPVRTLFASLAELKCAFASVALVWFAPVRSAPVKFARVRFAPLKLAPRRLRLWKSQPCRSALGAGVHEDAAPATTRAIGTIALDATSTTAATNNPRLALGRVPLRSAPRAPLNNDAPCPRGIRLRGYVLRSARE